MVYTSLQNSLTEVFPNSKLNYSCCLLTVGIDTVALFKNSEHALRFLTLVQKIFMECPIHLGSGNFAEHWRPWNPCIIFTNVLLRSRGCSFWNQRFFNQWLSTWFGKCSSVVLLQYRQVLELKNCPFQPCDEKNVISLMLLLQLN